MLAALQGTRCQVHLFGNDWLVCPIASRPDGEWRSGSSGREWAREAAETAGGGQWLTGELHGISKTYIGA